MSSVQCLLPRLDILVFFSGLKGTIFWYDKDPKMPFFKVGRGRRYAGSLFNLHRLCLLPNLLMVAHFSPVFPLVPGPGGKEGSACLGTGPTGSLA